MNAWRYTWLAALLAASVSAQEPPAPDAGPDPGELSSLLDTAVVRLAAQARADAQRWLAQKRYPEARQALETAHELDPRDFESAERLAELESMLGHTERAERLYRELLRLAPERAGNYLALGDLLLRDRNRPERLAEAAQLYDHAQERLGSDDQLLLRRARLSAAHGAFAEAERAYQAALSRGPLDDALALELGDFYRDAGRQEDALAYYRKVSGQQAPLAAQRAFELEVEREALRYGLRGRDDAAEAQAHAVVQSARKLRASQQLTAAEAMLREALAKRPAQAELRAELAELLVASGRAEAAELEYLRAIALDGSQPEVFLRLSELYLGEKPLRAAEAAWLLPRALGIRPDWARPHLLLARAYRELGDLPRALMHVTRFLSQTDSGTELAEAVALQTSLAGALGSTLPAAPEPDTSPSGAEHLARARRYLAAGQTDAALAELQRLEGSIALREQAQELQVRVLYAAGRLREAGKLLEEGLRRRPDQQELRELSGQVWLARGEPARARSQWLQCERGGRPACGYRLARLELDRPPVAGLRTLSDLLHVRGLWHARTRLAALDGVLSPLSQAELTRTRAELNTRLWTLAILLLSAALLGLGFVLWLVRARWGGLDLAALLARHPQAAPEVQRVLSAIRHEVLKHNTLMLAGVAEGLRRSDASGVEPAAHLARALVGEDGKSGAAERFDAYVAQLAQIGRAYGERLNAYRRDRALSSLHAGFNQVKRLRAKLMAAGSLSVRARARLAKALLRANQLLNVQAQAEVNQLLDGLRGLQLTAATLEASFARVRGEPALSAEPIEPLAIDSAAQLPCAVAIGAQAFDDILANLFRNALQASLRYPEPRPVRIGVCVRRQFDDITGLASIEVRVRDRSPEPLDPAKLQGGYIEAGLGLTADLVARHAGQLSVHAPEPGYSKAVVLRLPEQRSEAT
ncbi:MAG TPA: tetratricopeptide repeat protein [Polyangiales bacterium]|nr:tetratricopeptide repeat protein [Polyangiales bacterium]